MDGEASNRPLNHSPNKPIVAHLACEGMLPNPKGIVVGLLVAEIEGARGERPVKKRRADEEKRMNEGRREGGREEEGQGGERTRMGLKWRQLVVLDSAPLFFLSTCRLLPFTHAYIYASTPRTHVHAYNYPR